jgi:hypothetical protein
MSRTNETIDGGVPARTTYNRPEGMASPELTRQPAGGSSGLQTDLDEEGTGRAFAEGMASPELTRKNPGDPVDEPVFRRTTR